MQNVARCRATCEIRLFTINEPADRMHEVGLTDKKARSSRGEPFHLNSAWMILISRIKTGVKLYFPKPQLTTNISAFGALRTSGEDS
jgi:hypothetical protein